MANLVIPNFLKIVKTLPSVFQAAFHAQRKEPPLLQMVHLLWQQLLLQKDVILEF